jgi:hypothetical protein
MFWPKRQKPREMEVIPVEWQMFSFLWNQQTRYSTTLKYFGDGERISDIQGGSYGHTVGGGVGLTMLQSKSGEPINRDYIQNARWELEIANCQQEISLFSFFGAILRSKEHPHQGMSRTNSVVRAKSYSL